MHQKEDNLEVSQAKRMLREIGQMAEDASLTGSIKTGAARLAEFYNRVLNQLEEEDAVAPFLFEPIPAESADFGRIAVDAHMLEAALGSPQTRRQRAEDHEEGNDFNAESLCALAPFLDSQDLGLLVREKMDAGVRIPDHVLTSLAPFLDSSMLGELVRQRIDRVSKPAPPRVPVSEPPPNPADRPDISLVKEATTLASPRTRAERIQELAGQLARPEISDEDRGELLRQIASLSWPG